MTHSHRGRPSAGFSLIEVIVATSLSTLLILLALTILIRVESVFRSSVDRLEFLETTRVGIDRIDRIVQSGGLDPGTTVGPDGLFHRAWRGSAAWCGDGWVEFPVRLPDPTRDSLWWVDANGALRLEQLRHREVGGCGGAGVQLAVAHSADPARMEFLSGGVVRWFERGRLRVDDAVRYGRVGFPAQPLTPAVLAPRAGAGGEWRVGSRIYLRMESQRPESGGRSQVARSWWYR